MCIGVSRERKGVSWRGSGGGLGVQVDLMEMSSDTHRSWGSWGLLWCICRRVPAKTTHQQYKNFLL